MQKYKHKTVLSCVNLNEKNFFLSSRLIPKMLTWLWHSISCMDNQHKEPLQALRHFDFELDSSVPVFLLYTLIFASDWLYNYLAFQVSNKCWPKTIELPLQVRMQCWIHYLHTPWSFLHLPNQRSILEPKFAYSFEIFNFLEI